MPLDPLHVFQTAFDRAPAYRAFLAANGSPSPRVGNMEEFLRLPLMSKENYISKYPLPERCLDGTLQSSHIIMHSSGSSGKYVYWPSSPDSERNYWRTVYDELDASFAISRKPTLLILGVLMGGNMSGALFAYALRAIGIETGKTTLITPGRDEAACLEAIRTFSAQFAQTILYSYPATAKNILEKAKAEGIPLEKYGIRLRLLGEGYSENYRDRINTLLGYPEGCLDSLSSGYGATDFRSAGRETPLCVAIKRLLHEQGKTRVVLDREAIPTLCQYDPETIHIESLEKELLMTRLNTVPLVRYRSGDSGQVIGYDAMLALLAEHGLEPLRLLQERGISPDSVRQRPFVLLDGRADGGVAFYGAKIDIAKVKATLEETPWLAERLSGEFQLSRGDDAQLQPFLTLAVVLRPDAPPCTESEVANVFADALAIRQKGIYAQLLADDRASALPRLRFVAREEIMTKSGFKIRYLA